MKIKTPCVYSQTRARRSRTAWSSSRTTVQTELRKLNTSTIFALRQRVFFTFTPPLEIHDFSKKLQHGV